MRFLRFLLGVVLVLVVVAVLAVGTVFVGLNTAGGREFAVREINRLAGPGVKIAGLGGHFPADIKLQDVQLADADGVWLHGSDLELRWLPGRLLHRVLEVEAVSAAQIDVLRQPVAGGSGSAGGGGGAPPIQVAVDRLQIGTLTLAPAVEGQAVALHVQGAARLVSETDGSVQLDASTPDGTGQYHVAGAIDAQNLSLRLHVVEPPAGVLGHYAGPQVQAPLMVDVALAGPRDDAALTFAMSLGAAKLQGDGHLGLTPDRQFADVTMTVPELAPFAALAGSAVAGSTQLHLRVAQARNGAATLALEGYAALTQPPAGLGNFLGKRDELALQASFLNGNVTIDKFHLSGADFLVDLSGTAGKDGITLATDAKIDQLAELVPAIAGNVAESGTVTGTVKDLAVQAQLTGTARAKGQASDPFDVALNIVHLPSLPEGILIGGGKLAGAPLSLDAAFKREAGGAFIVKINKSSWRTVKADADLHLAPGAALPTGTASFSVSNLQDFAPFVPPDVRGGANGDFAYVGGQTVKLNLTAKDLLVTPSLGAINGKIAASGPVQALAVKTQLTVAQLMGAPAQLAFAGVFDVQKRAASLASFSGSWRGLNAKLLGPTSIETQPVIAVRHLKLGLDNGSVALDGMVWPQLKATAAVQKLPLSIANVFVPSLGAEGTVDANATLNGPPTAPSGSVKLNVAGLHLQESTAAALPPADIAGSANLAGTSAAVDVDLRAGPDIALNLRGQAPMQMAGPMNLRAIGRVDLQLLNLFLAENGTVVHGEAKTNLLLAGTPQNPNANGTVTLRGGSVENIGTGLNLTQISADIAAKAQNIALQNFMATAGRGKFTGEGTLGLDGDMPIDFTVNADAASPIISDLISETLNGAVTLKGAVRGPMKLGGNINIAKAEINIPHGLPPSVSNLPIINDGEKPPPPPAPPPPIALALDVRARNQIFIRGDGLFAELGGHIKLGGTLAAPDPEGHFDMIRGNFALAGKTLQFTSGNIGFTGDGFIPALDLVATVTSATVSDASLTVGGTAAKPVITLSSTPPLPSDEVLAQLLFGVSASSLTPFQAASLAAALAQISGIGGGGLNPLDKVRNALGLDELSLGGSGTGPPTLQAGRYVAPGVYVGASQASNGQGTSVNVEINLYKGLKMTTSTGTSSSGGDSDSVGLTYQFNY